jgi:hypothetical protein
MTPYARHLISVLAALCALLTSVPSAMAFRIEQRPDTGVTGQIAGMPPRSEQEVRPGQTLSMEVGFQNRLGTRKTFEVLIRDIGNKDKPDDMFALSERATFGARQWVSVDRERFSLEQGEIGWINVTARAPSDVEPGSYYAAVAAYTKGNPIRGGESGASVSGGVGVQLFFTIPGDRIYDGEIERAESTSFVWRDRGTYVPLTARYRNTGNVTDVVTGRVGLESLFGKDVGLARGDRQTVLRGGVREYRFLWADPPWLGRFTPKVEFVGETGKTVSRELPPVWIIPSWKYILAALLAIILPIAWRIRERRKVRLLREELARARDVAAADSDDWDGDLGDDDWADNPRNVG